MSSSVTHGFSHRRNDDGTIDSVCRTCFLTVATTNVERDLDAFEREHICDKGMLRHIEMLRLETS